MQTPAPVDYARAHSVDEALALLERHGPESRLIAGGHSLIPMMRLRIAQPDCVIDINDLAELDYIRVDSGDLVIGEHYRIFHDAERVIADPIVRNRGTVGGSLCQADPAEDLSAVAATLRATLVIRSASGGRIGDRRIAGRGGQLGDGRADALWCATCGYAAHPGERLDGHAGHAGPHRPGGHVIGQLARAVCRLP